MKYCATGLVPDPVDLTHPQARDFFGAAGNNDPLPQEWSNDHLLYERPAGRVVLPEELLQFGTQSCVGFQFAESLWCEQRRLGLAPADCALVSARAAYFAGLRRTYGRNAVLFDLGSRPRDVWAAAREVGVVYWEDCVFTEAEQVRVVDPPPKGAWMAGSDPGFVIDLRFDTIALLDRANMLRRCIVEGHTVGLGLTISESFKHVTSDPWSGRGEESILGRHMVNAYAYDPFGVWIHHWWRGWGVERCRGRIAWSVLESPETTDLVVAVLDLQKWRT